MLVDTHCHLADSQFDADRVDVVARARAAGISHVIVIADSVPGTRSAVSVADAHGLSATAGVHPHEARTWDAAALAAVTEALAHPSVVAVGETGLDYHYDFSPRPAQRAAFEAQLELAGAAGKPVVVHAREADDDMAAILKQTRVTVVLHSFSSGPKVFDAGMSIGAYFSFSGMVTFKNWALTDRLTAVPPDRLLVETDAPYLAPVPHRGKRNEPAMVREVAARVAELRGEEPDQLAERTTANAARCFGPRILAHSNTPTGGK